MPGLGRQKAAERCSAKLGRGAARAGDQRSGWGRAGHCQGLKQEAAGGREAVGGVGGISEASGWPGGSGQCQGATGKSQCQLGAGRVVFREGALALFLSPDLTLFCNKSRGSCWSVVKPKSFRFRGLSGSSFPTPFSTMGTVMPTWGTGLANATSECSDRTWTKPACVYRPVPHLGESWEVRGCQE